jgi:hypothetical protein
MDGQDWTPVMVRRLFSKKELSQNGKSSVQVRDPNKSEKIRIAKLENAEEPAPKKRVASDSLQGLIRKRIEMTLNQEKADALCSFPRHTFKEIEANRLIPTEEQKRRIQQHFGIQLKIDIITA